MSLRLLGIILRVFRLFARGGGREVNQLVDVTVNSKEENS
jgi:hypothetical protein